VINEKKNYKHETANPEFFTCYEIPTFLPGASVLQIQLWDHQRFLHDELLGETILDLEDRFFSKKWRALKDYPIETRRLFHPSSKLPQGYLRMWTEIIPKDDPKFKISKLDIGKKPPAEYEIRMIIWDCKGIPRVNTISDTVDIYITAKINGGHEFKTDTHWRSTNGKGSFNWRIATPITLPATPEDMVTITVWDKDIVMPNEYIAEMTIPIHELTKKIFETDKPVKLYGDD